jgi:pimeloyl-ACP methyl ester carboxylesterase
MAITISKTASRAMLGFGAVAATLSATGVLYQRLASLRDRRKYPPRGKLVDVGGFRLHARDEGAGEPAVILEAGLTSMSAQWAWIQPEVAAFTRVIAYDRAGLGFSDCCNHPRDAESTARRLYSLLTQLEIPGPYVIAAHSLGGLFARMFACLYPKETGGLVLVDSVHPDQRIRWGNASDWRHSVFFGQLMAAAYLARVGVPRLYRYRSHMTKGLPADAARVLKAMACSSEHLDATSEEAGAFNTMCEQVRDTGPLPNIPIAVLSSDKWHDGWDEQWHSLQREVAALSSDSTFQIVPGSNHASLITDHEHAQFTVDAIRGIVDQVRSSAGTRAA